MTPGFSSSIYRFPDNSTVEATLLDLEIACSLDSPALSLSASFLCAETPGEVKEAHIQNDGMTIFTGRVDKQRVSISSAGVLLRLECRSRGALLLDNEAHPESYFNVSANTVFLRHIAPYGFNLQNPGGDKSLPAYTVKKGESEWDAFCAFAVRAYGFSPYVKGTEVILNVPTSVKPGIIISNDGKGEAFTSINYSFTPYNIISCIYLRDALGSYSSVVKNPIASYYGIDRKRYMIPPSEFMEGGGADAISRVKSSMLAREDITVTLPGIIEAELGQRVVTDGGIIEKHGFFVEGWTYKMDSRGYYTVLKLARTELF